MNAADRAVSERVARMLSRILGIILLFKCSHGLTINPDARRVSGCVDSKGASAPSASLDSLNSAVYHIPLKNVMGSQFPHMLYTRAVHMNVGDLHVPYALFLVRLGIALHPGSIASSREKSGLGRHKSNITFQG